VEVVRSTPHLIAIGAGTKPRLSAVPPEYPRVSLVNLRGVTEYEPSEFTFTALAGTPLREIDAVLRERGQYLPFDPLVCSSEATLGGAVASGLSGPGRVRYGAVRDFILGVKCIDGEGRVLRLGGKVVKNAAGFDVPKFLVGSLGRFGVLTEITFKIFPRPAATRTLRFVAPDPAAKAALLTALASGRWEFDALDAAGNEAAVFGRLAGDPIALDALAADLLARWSGAVMNAGDAAYLWQSVGRLGWAHTGGTLVKLAVTPAQVPPVLEWIAGQRDARGWISAAGNTAYLSLPAGASLPPLPWPALTLRGSAPLWPGVNRRFEVLQRVKAALDPQSKFPGLDD
jgi:glycolate oxidase FAD binding subunit